MAEQIHGCNSDPVAFIKTRLDACSNTFNSGLCTASGIQCYNTWNTCTDKCNFSCTTNETIFSSCPLPKHLATDHTPNIISVKHDPTTLEIGKTFSTRGKITIEFQDAPHNDDGFDPYFPRGAIKICAEDTPGTLWGRLIARHKYFENRQVEVYTGYCSDQLYQFNKQTYFISKLTGPDNSGKVVMTLKDPLILTETAKCPSNESMLVAQQALGTEFPLAFTLGGALDGVATEKEPEANEYAQVGTYILENNYLAGDPDQDRFFAELKHICIGSEVLEVRPEISPSVPVGWNLKLIDRGVCGSEIGPHEAGEKITAAMTFKGHISNVVCRLLECSDLETASLSCCEDDPNCVIDWDSFRQYKCDRPLDVISEDVIICKGETVKTLLDELSTQFLFWLYYDAETGKIKIKALSNAECNVDVYVINECDIVDGSFSVRETDTYYNQVEYRYNQIDCTKGIAEENLSDPAISLTKDQTRKPCDRREYKVTSKKTINSRWISKSNAFLARTYGDRYLRLRNCSGKEVSFEVTNDLAKCIEFGGFSKIWKPRLQNKEGKLNQDYWLLKGKAPGLDCTKLTFEKVPFNDNLASCLNCDTACPTVAVEVQECNSDCVELW